MAALGRPCRERCLSLAQVSEARNFAPISDACDRLVGGGVRDVGGKERARRRNSIDSLHVATNVEDLDAGLEGGRWHPERCQSLIDQKERRVYLDRLAVMEAQRLDAFVRFTVRDRACHNVEAEPVIFDEGQSERADGGGAGDLEYTPRVDVEFESLSGVHAERRHLRNQLRCKKQC